MARSVYTCYKRGVPDFTGTMAEVIAHYRWKGGLQTFRWYWKNEWQRSRRRFWIDRTGTTDDGR